MAQNIQDLDIVDNNNQANWPEGTMKVQDVNDAGRADEGLLARWFADWNGSKTTAGTGSAYTLSSDTAPTAYYAGLKMVVYLHADCEDDFTLNIDSLGAVTVLKNDGEQPKAGDYLANARVTFIHDGGTNFYIQETPATTSPASYNFIGGLITKPNGTLPDTDIDTSAGAAEDDGHNAIMQLATALTKKANTAWAVGNNQGMLDTGTFTANTAYYMYLIQRSDTGVVDVLSSLSPTSPTLPANYDRQRLFWYFKTNASTQIVDYVQTDNRCRYLEPVVDVNDSTITALTYETGKLSCPANGEAHVTGYMTNPGDTGNPGRVWIKTAGATDGTAAREAFSTVEYGGVTVIGTGNIGAEVVDGSSQVEYAATESGGTGTSVIITTRGFTMLTRNNP